MCNMNMFYNPDHQQVLEHHQELLKKAEQAQLVRSVMPTSKPALLSFRKLLRFVVSVRHTNKVSPAVSRTTNAQP